LRFTVAAVARRLGVAPATLRTWDRRYHLGPSEHEAGRRRRYTPSDVALLEAVRRLVDEGVPAGEAAQLARRRATAEPPVSSTAPARTGGGRVLPMPGAAAEVRGLGRAAMALDARTVTAIMRDAVEREGTASAWERVIRPVLTAAGARWAATGEGVEVEHLLSECAIAVLQGRISASTPSAQVRPVLLACAPGEAHSLPLYALGASLAEVGLGSRMLGPSLPTPAVRSAVVRTGPAALFLWSQQASTGDPEAFTGVPVLRPATALVAGGPGWKDAVLPSRVRKVGSLVEATHLLASLAPAVGSGGP
jgi:DNA-binding transcriptional MerR regulator